MSGGVVWLNGGQPVEQGSGETLPWSVDVTNRLLSGESVSAQTAALTVEGTGANYPGGLSGSPTLNGNVITQKVTALAAGTTYILAFSWTQAVGHVEQAFLHIVCDR
jgi:subtilisin family serine protease